VAGVSAVPRRVVHELVVRRLERHDGVYTAGHEGEVVVGPLLLLDQVDGVAVVEQLVDARVVDVVRQLDYDLVAVAEASAFLSFAGNADALAGRGHDGGQTGVVGRELDERPVAHTHQQPLQLHVELVQVHRNLDGDALL